MKNIDYLSVMELTYDKCFYRQEETRFSRWQFLLLFALAQFKPGSWWMSDLVLSISRGGITENIKFFSSFVKYKFGLDFQVSLLL